MAVQSKISPDWWSHLWGILMGSQQRRILLLTAGLIMVFLIYMQNRKAAVVGFKPKSNPQGKGNVDSVFFTRIRALLKVVIPTWKCYEVLDLCLLTVFLVLRTFMSIFLAGVNGKIVKAIIEKDFSLFVKRVLKLGILAIPASFVNSFLDFLNKRLAIRFKRRLTDHFHSMYLKDKVSYQIASLDSRVTNPDQRLTTDIDRWATSLSTIYSNFSKPTLDIFLFSRKLAQLVGWQGPTAIILWYFASGVILKFISPAFGQMAAVEQRLEGDYRSAHSSIEHHSEQIAFYKGNAWELTRIATLYNRYQQHSESIMHKKLFMGAIDSLLVKYGAVMVGYTVLGLPVFGPSSEQYLKTVGTDASVLTRDYIRNSSLLINLAKAIGRLVISYKEVQQLAGLTTVVYEMEEVLVSLSNNKFVRTQVREGRALVASLNVMDRGKTVETEDIIRFTNVPLVSPNGDVFLSKVSFEVRRGMNTIVRGPNGCGKSSLFRVLSGLWPLGGGLLERPSVDKVFYIPQRPYLPPGTLRDQIIYPHSLATFTTTYTDDHIRKLLEIVQLESIEKKHKGFDSVDDWNDVLSGGEKQRISMARLFYHKPLFAVLDQCTSAVSMEIEAQLYTSAKMMEITLFTISQRVEIEKFHQQKITFDGEKGYRIDIISSD